MKDLVGLKEVTRDWNVEVDPVGHNRILEETKGIGV